MAKKAANPIIAATQTNGIPRRVYVRDWRREPVGAVKQAQRIAIAQWTAQNDMDVEDSQAMEPSPDIDVVRHINQFGTPDVPLMEIACTAERKDRVVQFFAENEIQRWPEDINPLLAPDIYPVDTK